MTPPLTPADSDLRDFRFMPLDVVRLAQSDLVAFEEPAAVVAAILLWGAAWHGCPAGSLTNDDRALAKAAGYGRGIGEWLGVKEGALRGFVKCTDGRLYHPVVAEKVREAWAGKLRQRHRTFLAAIRKHNERNKADTRDAISYEAWEAIGRPKEVAALALPAPAQTRLALSGGDEDRFQGDDPGDVSHATNDNVTRDKGGVSRDQDPHVTQDSGSKGEGEGEGQGQGQGDSYNNNNRETRGDCDGVKPDPMDVTILADDLARRAGVPNTQPSSIMRNVEVVRTWLKDGIDLATIVEPEIDRFRLDKPEQRVASLLFFDQSVRAKVAATEAKARKGSRPHKPGITGPPVAPLKAEDDVDERVGMIRAKLNGNPAHHADAVALSIAEHGEDDGDPPTLIVTARSSFAASRVDRDLLRRITHELFAPLAFDVEVRVQ